MKRLIISAALVLLVVGGAAAQTGDKQQRDVKTAKAKKVTAKKTAKAARVKPVKATSDELNDRRMYKANNGQAATPTGHQATGTGEGYSSLKKDTAVIVPKAATKTKKVKEDQK